MDEIFTFLVFVSCLSYGFLQNFFLLHICVFIFSCVFVVIMYVSQENIFCFSIASQMKRGCVLLSVTLTFLQNITI